MNKELVPVDSVEILEEFAMEIERLRDCSVEDAEVMASNVLGRAYSSTHLVGLTDGGRRAVYWWSFTPGFVSISPFDVDGVDGENGIQIWRDADEETNDDFEQWLSTLTDGFDWLHPEFRDTSM
ncbi:hypothetical protein [Haloprofundus salilacus]|uniref:hypothetical protein n=1 Tax=Haloprofundus salilacus TaxID=2876190 RepID=UPI001CC8FA56|nr:hypothetical protein [Haloprofundus salilacus]